MRTSVYHDVDPAQQPDQADRSQVAACSLDHEPRMISDNAHNNSDVMPSMTIASSDESETDVSDDMSIIESEEFRDDLSLYSYDGVSTPSADMSEIETVPDAEFDDYQSTAESESVSHTDDGNACQIEDLSSTASDLKVDMQASQLRDSTETVAGYSQAVPVDAAISGREDSSSNDPPANVGSYAMDSRFLDVASRLNDFWNKLLLYKCELMTTLTTVWTSESFSHWLTVAKQGLSEAKWRTHYIFGAPDVLYITDASDVGVPEGVRNKITSAYQYAPRTYLSCYVVFIISLLESCNCLPRFVSWTPNFIRGYVDEPIKKVEDKALPSSGATMNLLFLERFNARNSPDLIVCHVSSSTSVEKRSSLEAGIRSLTSLSDVPVLTICDGANSFCSVRSGKLLGNAFCLSIDRPLADVDPAFLMECILLVVNRPSRQFCSMTMNFNGMISKAVVVLIGILCVTSVHLFQSPSILGQVGRSCLNAESRLVRDSRITDYQLIGANSILVKVPEVMYPCTFGGPREVAALSVLSATRANGEILDVAVESVYGNQAALKLKPQDVWGSLNFTVMFLSLEGESQISWFIAEINGERQGAWKTIMDWPKFFYEGQLKPVSRMFLEHASHTSEYSQNVLVPEVQRHLHKAYEHTKKTSRQASYFAKQVKDAAEDFTGSYWDSAKDAFARGKRSGQYRHKFASKNARKLYKKVTKKSFNGFGKK
ncbi:uncharacterized protein V1518DRAFT_412442 [Limtongia smithiae]|uniref:uncharacterized protein n=1 Tax=Limtongia smithiae TaxID=1125753 RepID=UPI0034CF3D1B